MNIFLTNNFGFLYITVFSERYTFVKRFGQILKKKLRYENQTSYLLHSTYQRSFVPYTIDKKQNNYLFNHTNSVWFYLLLLVKLSILQWITLLKKIENVKYFV